ncbi:MAG: AAA family ATPase [Candidatus Magasanikbacteria bacterium]|nr:AAA family ATPase [Candidatus Magasanikbacteria bacterium]
MELAKQINLPLIYCAVCAGRGRIRSKLCRSCHGLTVGFFKRRNFLYWGYPLTPYNFALERARRIFNRLRFFTVLAIGLNFWVWAGVIIVRLGLLKNIGASALGPLWFITNLPKQVMGLFWLGLLFFTYAWYRSVRERAIAAEVERFDYNNLPDQTLPGAPEEALAQTFADAIKLPHKLKRNIADTFTGEARQAIGLAFRLAQKSGHQAVSPLHLFYSLLSLGRIGNIFVRLGVSPTSLEKALESLFKNHSTQSRALAPSILAETWQVLFLAYNRAYEEHQKYVSVTELLEAAIAWSQTLQEILFDLGIDRQKLINVIVWARVRERLHREAVQFRSAARHRSKHGMDRAMTALATPYLDRFSEDLTLLAQRGYTEECMAREPEIEEIFRVVEGGVESVLLVGDYGVGKKSIVDGIAKRMIVNDVPNRLFDKRLIRLSTSALLSGARPEEALERLMIIMNEIARARNIILFVHNIHELIGVSLGGAAGQSLDVASSLSQFISGGRFLTLATTTTEAFTHTIRSSALSNAFTKVEVREMDENQAIQVLESKVGYLEYKNQVFFSYGAIEKAVQYAKRYLHDVTLPGAALEILTESAAYARNHKGAHALVLGEEVAAVVAEKTHIPLAALTANESTKLLNLEKTMHERVVGQDEAVALVANALRRARAEIRAATRPIANFLFLGPTGVGKTELAKTIAEVYFGGENKMARLDMSEYQDASSIYRLIGAPNQPGSGALTEAIRQNPFTLLLLDEIEKADKDILNLFLQVMDDGRLTDSTGRVVDLTNIILIATSNAGTSFVSDQMRMGVASEEIKNKLLHGQLRDYFKPEFLNRFDGIVLFKPLSEADIKQVAGFMLKRIINDLDAKGIKLEIGAGALDFLASIGFDSEFGARPMRRALEDKVENKLAELILKGQLKRRDTVILDGQGNLIQQP